MNSKPYPLGPTLLKDGINFAIYAPYAKEVAIHFPENNKTVKVDTRTGDVWHIFIQSKEDSIQYQWLIDKKLYFDPFSPELETSKEWGAPWTPVSKIAPAPFDWQGVKKPHLKPENLIIYEMHVRGFSKHSSSQTQHPGTFLGLMEKIPYLVDLGINAVELLPIHEFNEGENSLINPLTKERLFNYWGYSTVSFFSLMNRYSTERAALEFKTLVRELHRFGIEVIMDVVYNHTYNEENSPYKMLAKDVFYAMENENLNNDTGCGNTVRVDHAVPIEMVMSSLRHFAYEYQVDGFRFDLATIFKKQSGEFVKILSTDPVLAEVKLIAEPWDLARYEVGHFWPGSDRWSEWNGKYRDAVRSFIKGDPFKKSEFATRLMGSNDLYADRGNPAVSVNFVTAHDGFTLHDLVSYNSKHNNSNGEKNRDGLNENVSWNCGQEGPTKNKKIIELRQRQQKNFFMALLLSKGIPMIHMGDEIQQTKLGNNNTWCQDNDLSWFRWDLLEEKKDFWKFVKKLIEIRKQEPVFTEPNYLGPEDIEWHGFSPSIAGWDQDDRFVAVSLKKYLYIAFNASANTVDVNLPEGDWHVLSSSSLTMPEVLHEKMKMEPYSSILLKKG